MFIYLDHNAATTMDPVAIRAMTYAQELFVGNPSSTHREGRHARECLEAARVSMSGMIGCKPGEFYFTSGGTEANNWAVHGALYNRPQFLCLVSETEHKSVLKPAQIYDWHSDGQRLEVDEYGVIDFNFLFRVLERNSPAFVSVMIANNETGVIQEIVEIAKNVKLLLPKSLVHTDACQAFGKIPVNVDDLGVDLLSLSAHKVGGPRGVGALYIREGTDMQALILGGHQEHDLRAGTENVAGVVAFQVAASHRLDNLDAYRRRVSIDRNELEDRLLDALDDINVNGLGDRAPRLPNTTNIRFDGVESDALVLMLSERGVYVSNGSACEAGSLEGSHVLKAMGQTDEQSKSAIRFSLSDDLPDGAIEHVAKNVIECVQQLREMGNIKLLFRL